MKHKEILSRSWKILWSYKVLWVFGIILALTTSSSTDNLFRGGNSGQDNTQSNQDFNWESGEDFEEGINEWFEEMESDIEEMIGDGWQMPADWENVAITVAIVAGCVIFILIILSIVFRYVSETALIKLVDENEQTGTKRKVRAGFRLGFSRQAWRMFLADVVVTLPTILAFLLLFAIAIAPFFLWMTENVPVAIIGTVAGVGFFFLLIFLAIIVGAGISLLKRFIFRQVALVDVGPIEAIKLSFSLVRRNFKDVILMWLIMVGIGLGFALVMIPIGFLLLALSAIIGGALGLSVGGVASFFTTDTQSIIAGVAAGAPVFLLLLISPLAFLSGLKETYFSTTWTLTYREVVTLDALEVEVDADLLADDTGAPPELEDSSQA